MSERREEQEGLEAALPSLVDKLDGLRNELNDQERTVFDEIVRSAARHADDVNADDVESHGDRVFMKPMSVHLTVDMRQELLETPKRLGIEDQPGQQ